MEVARFNYRAGLLTVHCLGAVQAAAGIPAADPAEQLAGLLDGDPVLGLAEPHPEVVVTYLHALPRQRAGRKYLSDQLLQLQDQEQ